MKLIKFNLTSDGIVITIPLDLLKYIAEEKEDFDGKVKNIRGFASEVMFELEENLGQTNSGLSGFQELIDDAIDEVYESASENIKYEDE